MKKTTRYRPGVLALREIRNLAMGQGFTFETILNMSFLQ